MNGYYFKTVAGVARDGVECKLVNSSLLNMPLHQ